MHFNIKHKENEFFITSLYEIDRILEELGPDSEIQDKDKETLQLIHERLLKTWWN
jgi:hypothetical protein